MNPLDIAPVIPVVVLDDPSTAVPLAEALLDGGIGIIEVTLRSDAALPAIEAIAAEVPEMLVGAGTLVTPVQIEAAVAAGARFLVSPGATPTLLDALADTGLPYLPGVATVSEILTVLERGVTEMKFFPAESSGGASALKAFGGPLPQVRFCPTGGITPATAPGYLALPNVGCVGGSWLTPAEAVRTGDWGRISDLARAAAALRID
ncbi:bifunctional 4-hydroxy-2-oxoglutarate aldolase/2-dehydro-3-deoxy-phosphogluconate aldolase [Nocardia sp. NEAU-G5]|uniref:2-dehydro-3-deoxy-phosphogluconate aldolase n=1 Tax=Nocardia albiluteola TaxID=2842303 RepID=A0ABS6B7K4_9NOCA|nr:bifunctional 4-hydroxy-2-oxoglutarate aldolase/2-dehydro-3-deoxy-phosphogluconate aldolase [Nocardia albiluteola]MBU3065731.1 bifunctional 4-hydroxy-2-oxoglutarate aldolase/2-dehydro-3-deoxy-phosphogluconate aldolase [Nocardia albiluteola]